MEEPKQYKKLFIDGGNYYEFSHIARGDLSTQIGGYRIGYKAAADNLIEDALSSKDIFKLDTYVFPAILHIPDDLEHSFRTKPNTDSDSSRTPIPAEDEHFW